MCIRDSPGMDLDPGDAPAHLRHDPGQGTQQGASHPDGMGHAMCPDGMDTLIAQCHQNLGGGCRILAHGCVEVFGQTTENASDGLESVGHKITWVLPGIAAMG